MVRLDQQAGTLILAEDGLVPERLFRRVSKGVIGTRCELLYSLCLNPWEGAKLDELLS